MNAKFYKALKNVRPNLLKTIAEGKKIRAGRPSPVVGGGASKPKLSSDFEDAIVKNRWAKYDDTRAYQSNGTQAFQMHDGRIHLIDKVVTPMSHQVKTGSLNNQELYEMLKEANKLREGIKGVGRALGIVGGNTDRKRIDNRSLRLIDNVVKPLPHQIKIGSLNNEELVEMLKEANKFKRGLKGIARALGFGKSSPVDNLTGIVGKSQGGTPAKLIQRGGGSRKKRIETNRRQGVTDSIPERKTSVKQDALRTQQFGNQIRNANAKAKANANVVNNSSNTPLLNNVTSNKVTRTRNGIAPSSDPDNLRRIPSGRTAQGLNKVPSPSGQSDVRRQMDFNIAAGKEIQNANANLGTGTNPVVAPVTSPMKYDSKGSPISTTAANTAQGLKDVIPPVGSTAANPSRMRRLGQQVGSIGRNLKNMGTNFRNRLRKNPNPVVAPVTSPMKYDSKGSPISTPTAHPTPTPTPQTTSAVALADGTDVPIDAAGAGLPGWVKPTAIGTAGIGVGSIGMNMYNNRNKQRNTY